MHQDNEISNAPLFSHLLWQFICPGLLLVFLVYLYYNVTKYDTADLKRYLCKFTFDREECCSIR